MKFRKRLKLQPAFDFMASYGIAIIIITIAVAAIYTVTTSQKQIFAPSCSAYSGFTCGFFSINSIGALNISLVQTTGAVITVRGVACSTSFNSTGNLPTYGNLEVTNSIAYYPSGDSPSNGITMQTGTARSFNTYCYDFGRLATAINESNSFVGYIWLNYTISGSNANLTQLIANVNTRYS